MPRVSPTPPAHSCMSLSPTTCLPALLAPILCLEVVAEAAVEAVEAAEVAVALVALDQLKKLS